MPAPLVGWIIGGLVSAAGSWVIQALTTVGVSMVVTNYALPPIMETLQEQLSGAPALFVQTVMYMGVDVCIGIVLSAYLVAAGSNRISGLKKK